MKGVNFQSCAILENKAWFVTVDNHFMWMDVKTKKTHYVMPEGNKIFYNVINQMIVIGRGIYWADQNGKRFLSYNLDSGVCKAYEMNNVRVQDYIAFSLIDKWENTIVLVPKYTDEILFFDTQKERFIEEKGIFTEYITDNGEGYVNHAFVLDECIYFFLTDNCTALRYSMYTGVMSIVARRDLKRGILTSYWYKDMLYVLDIGGDILTVNRKFELIQNYTNSNTRLNGYCCIVVHNDKIICLPSTGEEIITIDLENETREQLLPPSDLLYEDKNWGKYVGYTEQTDFILVPNRISNYILFLDKKNYDVQWIKPISPDEKEEAQYMVYTGVDTFKEDRLGLLIKYICLK